MANNQNETIKGSIVVKADDWKRYKTLKAEISALEKQAKGIEAGFPLPAIDEENVGTWIVVDGNNDTQGKLSIYFHPGAVQPSGYRKRLS